jgi:hypothetical protein
VDVLMSACCCCTRASFSLSRVSCQRALGRHRAAAATMMTDRDDIKPLTGTLAMSTWTLVSTTLNLDGDNTMQEIQVVAPPNQQVYSRAPSGSQEGVHSSVLHGYCQRRGLQVQVGMDMGLCPPRYIT